MATIFLDPGGDATFDTTFWSISAGTPAVATDFVHGGHVKSYKLRPGNADQLKKASILADAGIRLSFYIYLNAAPTGNTSVPLLFNNSGDTNTVFALNITSGRVLQIMDNNGTQLGSNGATLSLGTWTRITIAYTITSTTVNTIKVFVNGSISITDTNVTLTGTGTSNLLIGNTQTDATLDFRISDIYMDNSSALTDPASDVWVTAKRPNANGATNGYTTQIGSGGSGYGTGHSPQVNERPLSTTNGWSMVGAGSAVTEEYNIEGASVGDINISSATLIDYMGWLYSKSLASETAKIIVNNVQNNISLTSTNTLFLQAAGSTTYPAGTGTDIGQVTSTTLTTVSLYECGIVFAYTPATSGGPLNWPILDGNKFWGPRIS